MVYIQKKIIMQLNDISSKLSVMPVSLHPLESEVAIYIRYFNISIPYSDKKKDIYLRRVVK